MIQKTPCRQVPGAKVMVVVCRPARVCSCCSRVPGNPRERFMPGPALRSTSCRASVHHDDRLTAGQCAPRLPCSWHILAYCQGYAAVPFDGGEVQVLTDVKFVAAYIL